MKDLEKSILIITATEDGLQSAGKYLSHKGWDVKSTSDLREALGFMSNNKPDVVLVCMDHPNKNISNLPSMILERVRCCVILTMQKATLETHYQLQKIPGEYRIFPPLAGLAVERTYKKYLTKLDDLLAGSSSSDVRRSGVSPRVFKADIVNEKPSATLDYSNMTYSESEQKILVRGTEKVISEILEAEGAGQEKIAPIVIKDSTRVTCMLLECENFQGYLIAALGQDCLLDEAFSDIVHRNLLKFLEEQGESVKSTDLFDLKIKPVAFLDWAQEYANFLRKSIHKGNEVAFAFFPIEGVRANYKPSINDDMLSVPVSELYGDSEVGFDIYIYFPANNKYVLYTPSGSVFYAHQQKRLTERGIGQIHIKKEDLKNLNRYRAQRYFNAIVDEYRSSNSIAA